MSGVIEIDGNEFSMDEKELIGGGSFGQVYKMIWEKKGEGGTKMTIAAKFFNGPDSTKYEEFKKEVKNIRDVKHENIITLYGTTKDRASLPFLIMEYADCGSLHDCIQEKGPKQLSYLACHHLMLQLAKAVAYLHGRNPVVIHRDLKPQNLLLTNNYRTLKICDFGTVRELASQMTAMRGTPSYIAPEIFKGDKYTEKCDVYSFGIILWQVFSKKEPYHHLGNHEQCTFVNLVGINGDRPKLEEVRQYKNRTMIMYWIEQCWDQDPIRRPSMKILEIFLSMNPGSSLPETIDVDYIECKPNPLPIQLNR